MYIIIHYPGRFDVSLILTLLVKNIAISASHIIGPRSEKTSLWGFANDTAADQPAHPRSLITAFVFRFLESTICKLDTGDISIF